MKQIQLIRLLKFIEEVYNDAKITAEDFLFIIQAFDQSESGF